MYCVLFPLCSLTQFNAATCPRRRNYRSIYVMWKASPGASFFFAGSGYIARLFGIYMCIDPKTASNVDLPAPNARICMDHRMNEQLPWAMFSTPWPTRNPE